MIGEQEGKRLQQLACIGWAMEVISREVSRDAADADVRSLAQLLLGESIQGTHRLRYLAGRKGCTLQVRLEPQDIDRINQLLRLSGGGFDRYYLQEVALWQERAAASAQELAAVTADAGIRKFAGEYARQAARCLPLVTRLLAQQDRRMAHARHYVW